MMCRKAPFEGLGGRKVAPPKFVGTYSKKEKR